MGLLVSKAFRLHHDAERQRDQDIFGQVPYSLSSSAFLNSPIGTSHPELAEIIARR